MEVQRHFENKFDNQDDDDNQLLASFNQIINHLKISQKQKIHQLSKKKKQLTKIIFNQLNPYNNIQSISKSISNNKNCQEGDQMNICRMQHLQLSNQIQEIKSSIRSLKESKINLQSQLSILQSKDQSINNALIISRKDSNQIIHILEKEKRYLHSLQIKNHKQLHQLQNKLKQVQEQIKNISLSLIFKNKNIFGKNQYHNVTIIKHLPQIQKPIYTKLQLQSILRSFYVILKMKEKWNNNDFEKVNFEEQLDSIEKIRTMSKWEILNSYESKDCLNNQLVNEVCQLYQSMSSKFQRTQRLNLQLTQNLNQLRQTQHQLDQSLEKINQNKAKQTIQKLIQDEKVLKNLEDKIYQNCRIIFKFNIIFHQLIKKTLSLNKTFDKVMKKAKKEFKSGFKKTFYESNMNIVKNFQQLLERSPQQIKFKWKSLIEQDYLNQQGYQYINFVIKNDLVRMIAAPKFYSHSKSILQNYESTFNKVFEFQQMLIDNFYRILQGLLKGPLDAIQKHYIMKQYCNEYQNDNKQNINESINRLCVESKQYFRRDDYKLLQKIEKIQLKKKGLYYNAPFEIGIQNQLVINDNKQLVKRLSLKNIIGKNNLNNTLFLTTSRHNILSEKRSKMGSQQKSIRKILGQVSQIASKNHQYRIKKQRNTHQPFINYKI